MHKQQQQRQLPFTGKTSFGCLWPFIVAGVWSWSRRFGVGVCGCCLSLRFARSTSRAIDRLCGKEMVKFSDGRESRSRQQPSSIIDTIFCAVLVVFVPRLWLLHSEKKT